ncbi:MAG: anthranilate synthase component I [Candidatus Latescibacterota bacterium]
MIRPTFDQIETLATQGNVIPVAKEILADMETPVSAYQKIRNSGRYSFLLESVEGGEKIARYSFLGADPFLVFRSKGDRISLQEGRNGHFRTTTGDPLKVLRELLGQYQPVRIPDLPRFTGGAVGVMGYDGVRLAEELPDQTADDLDLDEMVWMFFDTLLAFDNVRHKMILISNVHTDRHEGGLRTQYETACRRIEELERLLLRPVDPLPSRGEGRCQLASNTTKEDFMASVRRAKEYISAGDVIQVVLSQRFEMEISVGSFDIYRMLRIVNPSPYMFHMAMDDLSVVGASPELMVRMEKGTIEVRPIAGTRMRGETEQEDQRLSEELLADEKERAEHIMLVDLGRNDVGRVSIPGSVEVTELMKIERYSHVMHIVSNVQGKVRPGVDAIDGLLACFPAGTVSGAPKIRAMEILDELEPTRRGIYAGAVGYFDFSGNLDSCIAIRTIVVKDSKAYVQAGAGIVADSDPEREFEETEHKARAMVRAIEMAENSGDR